MTQEEILQALGRFPSMSRKPGRRQLVDETDGIQRYLVEYEAEPGELVSAWLLVPIGAVNSPAIVACHQHNDEYFVGKSEPAGIYPKAANTFGLTLCQAGYVVICPDQLGFEDRRPKEYLRRANPAIDGQQYERQLFMEYLLHNSTLQAKCISDLTRAVDILLEQPEVDAQRLGVCGHSLGGQESLWLAWYDPRIRVLATSCGFALIADLQARGINHNYAMYLPGFLEHGDMQDILIGLCPKPTLICHGALDPIYPRNSVEKALKMAQEAYAQALCPEHFKARIFETAGHVFEQPQQEEAVNFFKKWL